MLYTHISITRIQTEPTVIIEDNSASFQSTLSWHHSSRAWRCRSVSGSLARDRHDLSPAASRRFPMVLGDTAGATCTQISSLDVATTAHTMCQPWHASVLRGRAEPGLRVWECTTDYCWNQRRTKDSLCTTCAAVCPSSFPQAYHNPIQWPDCNNRCKRQDDIQHLYGCLHVRIHACIVARGGYTVYWCDCLGTSYRDMCFIWSEFIIYRISPNPRRPLLFLSKIYMKVKNK